MRIFVDYHHSSLFNSFLYTLEARLGHEVYRQVGESWFKKGYWQINRHPETIQQYLGTYCYQPLDGTPPLNNVMWVQDDIYYSRDPNTAQVHKAITWETYLQMDWDVVIASIPAHVEPFSRLAQRKKAKFVFQMGNEFPDVPWEKVDNLMASVMTRDFDVKKSVFYAQEFDLNKFNYTPPPENKTIVNFMNVLKNYPEALKLFKALEKEMPDYTFKMYGSQNRDGCISGVEELASQMKQSRWIYHVKPGGDGYGHVIHNAYAVGRPMIVKKDFYDGKLAGRMIKEDNAVIVGNQPPSQIAKIIRDRENVYNDMSRQAYQSFCQVVDFEKDAINIQKFLEDLA